MTLVALPAFNDNYIWMFHHGRQAVVVDPGDAAPVEAALDRQGLELAAILVTHHHPDHVGGIARLRSRLQGEVYAPAQESIPQRTVGLEDGDVIEAAGRQFEAVAVPGHTTGHLAFFERNAAQAPLLFCGDTLFSAGCGRLFEGTAGQMHRSLQRLSQLPGDTQVCCAHEYTLSNLRFAQAVEPANTSVAAHRAHCDALRAEGRPTLPSTILLERAINPFLRCGVPEVVDAARQQGASTSDPAEVLRALREWKNRFQ